MERRVILRTLGRWAFVGAFVCLVALNVASDAMAGPGREGVQDCWTQYEQYANESLARLEACNREYADGSHPMSQYWQSPVRWMSCSTSWVGRSVSAPFQLAACSAWPVK